MTLEAPAVGPDEPDEHFSKPEYEKLSNDDDANDSNIYDGGERVSQNRINQSIDQQKTF